MDARKLLQDWLNLLKWEGNVVVDEDDPETFQVDTPLRIAQHYWRMVVRASSETGLVTVRLYAAVVSLDRCRADVCLLMNHFNSRRALGAFALLDDGRIYFRMSSDFEGLSPIGRSVALMSGPAAEACLEYHEALFAVALGQRPLSEVIADLDTERESAEEVSAEEARPLH